MKKLGPFVPLGVMSALLSTSVSVPLAAQAQPRGHGGYCRVPAPLPALGAEEQAPKPANWRRTREGSARDIVVSSSPVTTAAPSLPPPPPPPSPEPAAPPSVAESRSGDSAARAESAPATTSGLVRGDRPILPGPRPRPDAQAGQLTAGDHDDLLNPELYARYVAASGLAQTVRDLPRVDTGRMLTVRVADSAGRPAAFYDVVVTCSDGNQIRLKTQADGRVTLFPDLDRLSPSLTVAVRGAGGAIGPARRVTLAQAAGSDEIGFTVRGSAAAPTKLDLMLVVDTTGSMADEIDYLKAELGSIVAALQRRHADLDIRIGFVFYRDIGDDYVTQTIAFGRDIDSARSTLARQSASGGGDYPEAMDQALIRAVGQPWRPDAVKTLLLVADAPPHDDRVGRAWAAAEVARAQRIHIVPVAASGVAAEAEYVMRAMAAATQSRYLFLTDDSGIGNAHAAPAIDCYLVTRLDGLIRRVIDSQLSGRRIEPDAGEVIRTVGTYDHGRCLLPRDFASRQ